jgi:hypothetical protein
MKELNFLYVPGKLNFSLNFITQNKENVLQTYQKVI